MNEIVNLPIWALLSMTGFIGILLTTIGFFLVRTLKGVEDSNVKLQGAIEGLSKSISAHDVRLAILETRLEGVEG